MVAVVEVLLLRTQDHPLVGQTRRISGHTHVGDEGHTHLDREVEDTQDHTLI